jgi:hypothetical protein
VTERDGFVHDSDMSNFLSHHRVVDRPWKSKKYGQEMCDGIKERVYPDTLIGMGVISWEA